MINFPFGTNGKSIILGVPILKPSRVVMFLCITVRNKRDQMVTEKLCVLWPCPEYFTHVDLISSKCVGQSSNPQQ